MKAFKIPVHWEVSGIIEIEAENLEKDLDYFDKNSDYIKLPKDEEYIDGSFDREDDETCELNN